MASVYTHIYSHDAQQPMTAVAQFILLPAAIRHA
jgi:hypothetical protein